MFALMRMWLLITLLPFALLLARLLLLLRTVAITFARLILLLWRGLFSLVLLHAFHNPIFNLFIFTSLWMLRSLFFSNWLLFFFFLFNFLLWQGYFRLFFYFRLFHFRLLLFCSTTAFCNFFGRSSTPGALLCFSRFLCFIFIFRLFSFFRFLNSLFIKDSVYQILLLKRFNTSDPKVLGYLTQFNKLLVV